MNPGGNLSITDVNGLIALASGLLSFFTPCILPLVPSYLIYISGITFDDMGQPAKEHRRKVFFHSLFFILGFSLVFVTLGVSSSLLGTFFARFHGYIMRIGGIVLVILGLFYLDIIKIPLFNRQYVMQLERRPIGLAGSFVIGITFSLGWTPCVGPALSSILFMASMSKKLTHAIYLLSMYSLGLAIPFLVSSLIFDRLLALLKRYGFVARYVVKVLGVMLIIIGLLLATSYYNAISLWVNSLLSFAP